MKINKKQAIKFLRIKLKEIPHLRDLPLDNVELPVWRDEIKEVLEEVFGNKSKEYQKFYSGCKSYVYTLSRGDYHNHLTKMEAVIRSIIHRYEIMGFKIESEAVSESKDEYDLPSYIFDNMQFHQDIVEASKSLFDTKHYAEAIFEAFKAVENYVRKKTCLSLYGKQLMAKAFNEDEPLIQVMEGDRLDKDVQEGFKFMFMGATVGIRNPKAHHRIIQRDPFITLEYLGFASFLLKRISGWHIEQGKQAQKTAENP